MPSDKTPFMTLLRPALCLMLCLLACGASAAPPQPPATTLATPDGGTYRGPLVNGKMHGRGKLSYASGVVYDGEFKDGLFSGAGKYRHANGALSQGEFRGGVFVSGKLSDAQGNTYEGRFVQGQPSGKVVWTSIEGDRYEGAVKDWKFDGIGFLRSPDGDEYRGAFRNGLFEGEGTLVYAKTPAGGRKKVSGTWHEGVLDDPAADKQTRANVETVLYNQRALLERSLGSLQPRIPGKINLYFLGVGGDGAQEVFRRETAFVQQQFDRDYGTKGRSMVLLNSRSTSAEQPMATVTSLRESLAGIGAKMDKQHDILFLFLTSHGSPEHQFSLAQNGMDLPQLEAKELASLLKQSAIRWKVIVISACYAGGFIPFLKDDTTLVIAAARSDRTSFGCADDNDFTYFSEAYFKDALPGSASFVDAFAKARVLVAAREAEDFKAAGGPDDERNHSEPQMHSAKPIELYLKTWRAQLK